MNKDKHLNYFWVYGRSDETSETNEFGKSINGLENNITRSIYVTFSTMKDENKIDFINRLIGKDFLRNDIKYEFEYELQQREMKDRVAKTTNKYLIGFCPRGDVAKTTEFSEILDLIKNAKSDHKSNPDLTIIVKDKKTGEDVLAIVLENKKETLLKDQIRRHLEDYMDIHNENEFSKHLIIKNYYGLFGLFEKYNKERFCKELLDYVHYLNLYARDISNLAWDNTTSVKEKKVSIGSVAYLYVLPEVIKRTGIGGNPKLQSGWGQTISFEKKKYINMIGLVYKEETDSVELNIKFAPNMTKARAFYKNVAYEDIENSGLSAHFTFGFKQYYYKDSKFVIENKNNNAIERYFNYFKDLVKRDKLNQVSPCGARELLKDIKKAVGIDINIDNCLIDLKDDAKLYNVSPTLERKVSWPVKSLINHYDNEKLINEIVNEIKKVKALII